MATAWFTPESESLLAALRAATREAHAELDAQLALTTALTRARYATFLRASMAVVAPLEARIACWLGLPADGFCRASALRADLEALGADSRPTPSARISGTNFLESDVPAIHSFAEAMGAAYVVEGSALGGAVLARAVAKALGDDCPRRYLALRGESTGTRWREFVHTLERWGAHAPAPARIMACESARATFAAYSSAFGAAGAFV